MIPNECQTAASKQLAAYVVMRRGFCFVSESPKHHHVGALLADGALQAGLNYRNVVFPRVARIERCFPEAACMSGLRGVLKEIPASDFLNWTHAEKIRRFELLISFFDAHADTISDIRNYLAQSENRIELTKLSGIGTKTVDYIFRLSGGAEAAIDRHVIRFIQAAGIRHRCYSTTKQIVNGAADLLGVPRDCFDASIWRFMSEAAA